jgi:hypothetical protein
MQIGHFHHPEGIILKITTEEDFFSPWNLLCFPPFQLSLMHSDNGPQGSFQRCAGYMAVVIGCMRVLHKGILVYDRFPVIRGHGKHFFVVGSSPDANICHAACTFAVYSRFDKT